MEKAYRWGILGAGRISEKFCTALRATTRSEVYAIASRKLENAKSYAVQFGATKYYDRYEDLAGDESVDIIYIATPHVFHLEQALMCLQQGKAVLCEKPLTLCHADSVKLLEAANHAGVFFMEGMWTACMPFMQKIREIIAAGTIGEAMYLHADFGFEAPKDLSGRLYNRALGGGSVLDIGIYPISLATILLGVPEKVLAATGLASTGVDEYASMLLQYSSGATAQLLSTINYNTPIEADIVGTKGRIKVASPWFKATEITVQALDETPETYSFPHLCNGFEWEIREVTHCLDNGLLQSTLVPHQLSLQVSSVMDDVLQQAGVQYDAG